MLILKCFKYIYQTNEVENLLFYKKKTQKKPNSALDLKVALIL